MPSSFFGACAEADTADKTSAAVRRRFFMAKEGLGPQKNGRKGAILASGACQGGIVHAGWWWSIAIRYKTAKCDVCGLWGNERLNNELGFIRL